MAAAQRLGLDRPGVFHPTEMINVVDVKVAETPAAGPEEAVEALNLPKQFTRFAGPFLRERRAHRSMHPIAAQHNEVADFAVLDALKKFLQRPAVTRHQADGHLEVFLLRFLSELEHPARGRAIHGDGLFHKHVQALPDGVSEVDPTKRRRRRENDNVARLQAVHRLLVGVETDELAILRDIDLIFAVPLHLVVTSLEPVIEHIGHGDQFDRTGLDGKGIGRGAGAPAAAADQGNLDRVVLRRMDARNGDSRQGRGRGKLAGVFDKVATRSQVIWGFVHS